MMSVGSARPYARTSRPLCEARACPDTEESLQRMGAAWLSKKRMFEDQARALDMQELASLPAADPRGALLLTWSGSLVSLEPPGTAGRHGEYASIELRMDVPHLVLLDSVDFPQGLAVDKEAEFSRGRSGAPPRCSRSQPAIPGSRPKSRREGFERPPST